MSDTVPDDHRAAEHTPDGGATSADAPADGATPPAQSPAMERLGRFTAANMLRSMLPLIVICLVLAGVAALKQNNVDPVTEVETATTVQFAARTADYELEAPAGLPDTWRATSARTDAGQASPGDPVTLELGYYTPEGEYAGFVTSDDARDPALTRVTDGDTEQGSEEIGGQTWTRVETSRGETAFVRDDDGATLVVTGSADEDELRTLAAAVQPQPRT
ncbi:DUF4245 family protein [Modestobacter sp. I12A-02628]|uniref:DUF4245 family protein n=1 Tax=Goekera deserti TaxID=2497753 RepID=A0A7K3WCR0_9ACTN|nr:DUF4245 domain-containing protein [Goekera deserti]MPQ98605.1 DUF4245 family protein [Goekera deserti]NDI49025.1 DUF4245 family protein [Goekera deserti]NEL54184.1 DUF4245 family protein [Goekera deserti]